MAGSGPEDETFRDEHAMTKSRLPLLLSIRGIAIDGSQDPSLDVATGQFEPKLLF